MSRAEPADIRVKAAMNRDDTVHIGTYKMLISGNGVGGLIPKKHARQLGLLDVRETEVYVNHDIGVVMHKIPREEDNEQ